MLCKPAPNVYPRRGVTGGSVARRMVSPRTGRHHWQVHVEADRDWPDGNGAFTAHVTVRQLIATDVPNGGDGGKQPCRV